jgi:hypothetical protein
MKVPRHELCRAPGCTKYVNYGYPGDKKSRCRFHKEEGMLDLTCRRCSMCIKRASYGFPGQPRSHCRDHKQEGMICYDIKCCKKCDKVAIMGYVTRTHCRTHSKRGMYNFTTGCSIVGCKSRASYGVFTLDRCKAHRGQGDRRLIPTMCEYGDCTRHASYSLRGGIPIYCKLHASPGMINVVRKGRPIEEKQLAFSCTKETTTTQENRPPDS